MSVLACPECFGTLESREDVTCGSCGTSFRTRYGIPSFLPTEGNDGGLLSADELAAFANRTEEQSVHRAIAAVNDDKRRQAISSELNSVNRDNWRILASSYLGGRCLDLNAGFGRRAGQLAPLVDEVYALESNVHKLRVLSARNEFRDAGPMYPVHATADALPFGPNVFDTVVLEYFDGSLADFRTTLRAVVTRLEPGSSVVVFTSGGFGVGKALDDILGGGRLSVSSCRPMTHGRLRSALRSLGFWDLETLSFLPTYSATKYVFDGGNVHNYDVALSSELDGRFRDVSKLTTAAFDRAAVLSELSPISCILARYEPDERSRRSHRTTGRVVEPQTDSRVVVSGRARAIVLDYSEEGLQRVHKVPNRRRHGSINRNEGRVVDHLRWNGDELSDTFPRGDVVTSPMGPIRREEPVSGTQLSECLSNGTVSFEACIDTVLEWLIQFQRRYRRSCDERVRTEVRGAASEYWPDESFQGDVTLFGVPVHGDLVSGNVFVEADRVSAVIDWEYGRLNGNPIVDSGYFLLRLGKELFGTFDEGFETLFVRDNGYSVALSAAIDRYCEQLEISKEAFYYYLPLAYVHRIEIEREHGIRVSERTIDKRLGRIDLVRSYEMDELRALRSSTRG
jgi:SAM-dependent methyltransferase